MAEIIHEDGSITVGILFEEEQVEAPQPAAEPVDTGEWHGPAPEPEAEADRPAPTMDDTRDQLVAQAEAIGLDVPSKATKAQLIAMINAAEEDED